MFEGVTIADQELDVTFKPEPECYGNITLTENEKEMLRLHPKYAVYEGITEVDCEAEREKALTKVRCDRKMKKEPERRTEHGEKRRGWK